VSFRFDKYGLMFALSSRQVKQFCANVLSVPKKNPHAVALGRLGGKKRVESLTPKQLSEIARLGGLVGGRARAEKLSAKRKAEIARKAATARWAKAKKN
jgi:hypothetical protein